MGKDLYKKKKCPRCKGSMYIETPKCPHCGLVFEKIQNLSNVQAKNELREKKYKNVLYVCTMPKDISKKKFWLLFAFLGWFGAHNIYVGNFKKGYYGLITGLLAVFSFAVFELVTFLGGNGNAVLYYFTNPIFTFFVFAVLIWFSDLIGLMFRKYKYPASLTKEDYEKVINEKIRGY